MRLRSQILLFLFIFGLTPLVAAVAINIPLVFDSLELLYHKAHLQNLRADFRDLDQHIAGRMELVRVLAKLPDADSLVNEAEWPAQDAGARQRFTDWANWMLFDQHDVVQVLVFDHRGTLRHALIRDWQHWRLIPDDDPLDLPEPGFLHAGLSQRAGGVVISPISVNPAAGSIDPKRFMVLRLISPIGEGALEDLENPGAELAPGVVVINLDVGGMAEAYRNTDWVQNDGTYLRYGRAHGLPGAAFLDYPGLEEVFEKGILALWRGRSEQQVLWVPMFVTERSGPLWVGRKVDPSPLAEFRQAVQIRVALVVVALIVAVLLAARWFALRAERLGRELTDGIRRTLTRDEAVRFTWRGSQDLQELAANLTRLAETHARNSRSLRAYARELEESNRYKSQFLANVSHELRTPLNSILLLSKLLADSGSGGLSPEQARQARIVHEAGRDLNALIDNILDLSRMEAGQAPLNPEPVELLSLLDDLLDLVRPQSDSKGLGLTLELDPEAPARIITDRAKLRQVLKNFLANAIKFTAQGQIRVVLDRNPEADRDSRPVRIRVADTGIGIPVEKHELIFEAFQQADGSTSRRYGGTGLGLTISRELAGLLGGRIHLESHPGEGATFSILLPLEAGGDRPEGSAPSEHASAVPAPGLRIPEADFRGHSVLLVDDDVRNLLALTPVLERWGLAVTGAGDGEEALEALAGKDRFDLVLMDIMLPGMDGNATIARLRADPRLHDLPVIALTARAGSERHAKTRAAGANDVLNKPVDLERLRLTIAPYLQNHPAGAHEHGLP